MAKGKKTARLTQRAHSVLWRPSPGQLSLHGSLSMCPKPHPNPLQPGLVPAACDRTGPQSSAQVGVGKRGHQKGSSRGANFSLLTDGRIPQPGGPQYCSAGLLQPAVPGPVRASLPWGQKDSLFKVLGASGLCALVLARSGQKHAQSVQTLGLVVGEGPGPGWKGRCREPPGSVGHTHSPPGQCDVLVGNESPSASALAPPPVA